MRIFYFLLKIHVDFAFTMKQVERSTEALIKVGELVIYIGCPGGNVQRVVKKDTGDTHEVAQQVSMSRGTTQIFFGKPPKKPSRKRSSQDQEQDKQWELWMELCKVKTDNEIDPINAGKSGQVSTKCCAQ